MLFEDITCSIITKDDSVIASGHKRGNLYVLDRTADRRPDEALVAAPAIFRSLASKVGARK